MRKEEEGEFSATLQEAQENYRNTWYLVDSCNATVKSVSE